MGGEREGGELAELVEIEKATARLQGRDPEQADAIVRARLDSIVEREARATQAQRVRDAARTRRRRRIVRVGLGMVAIGSVGAGAAVGVRAWLQRSGRDARLESALARLGSSARAAGFTLGGQELDVAGEGMRFEVAAGSCTAFVALREGQADAAPVRLARGSDGPVTIAGAATFCSCTREQVTFAVDVTGEGRRALRWSSVAAEAVGGVEGLAATPPEGLKLFVAERDRACAPEAFAAWSEATRALDVKLSTKDDPGVVALERRGLAGAGTLPAASRVGVVRAEPGQCYLVVRKSAAGDVELRDPRGRPLAGGPLAGVAFCAYANPGAYSLWHTASAQADHIVAAVAASRIGGTHGLRELGESLALEPFALVIVPSDLAADAAASLVASSVPADDVLRSAGGELASRTEHTVVAFTFLAQGQFTSGDAALPAACVPPLGPGTGIGGALCVEAGPQRWIAAAPGDVQGAASARRPHWLSLLADAREPEALRAMAGALVLGRRLGALGFEATTGVRATESATGAVVGGVAGRTQAVAIALTRAAPWVQPLQASEPWALDGPPGIVELLVDAEIALKAGTRLGDDAAGRRVVVWRR